MSDMTSYRVGPGSSLKVWTYKNASTVLEASRYREVVFEGSGPWDTLRGTLELHGSRQPLTVSSTRDGQRCSGSVEFPPSRWGIAPYRAFLGALKLDDRVRVSWELNLTPA